MNGNVVINSDVFENCVTSFEQNVKTVEDTLKNISELMREISGNNDTWKSKVGLAVHENYAEQEATFENINNELSRFTTFLKDSLKNYKNEEEKIETSMDSQSSSLDVNE